MCAGDIPQGELLDTSSVGNHSFTVTAEDQAGNSSTKTVSYEVLASGDTDAPQIWISQPSDGDSYEVGQVVLASYSCDDLGGSGLATCEGPVASEEPLDTATAGTHTFKVTASDHAGNTSSLSVSYLVRDPSPPPADVYAPYPVIRAPLFKQRYATGSHVEVDYECLDVGPSPSGIASCTGSLVDGATLDTTTPGTYSFAVIATDRAGNSSSRTVTYEVIDDSDGDGLADLWETEGIDVDNDGQIDLRLDQPPYNADPDHKDMFVETDWMECGLAPSTCAPSDQLSHKPAPGVADSVVAAFASAPLSNPDGTDGVRLHLDIDQAVPEISVLSFSAFPRPSGSYDDYDDIKLGGPGPCNGAFGTAAERSSTDCEDVLAAKSLVYRYGLWGHHHSQWIGSSGLGEYPGNDFIVTVGGSYSSWDSLPGGIASIESATLMHELGHTLGLGHGGPNRDDINCKPNYLSVMNYAFQSTDYYPDRPLDYSRQQLPTLDESALVEADGISGPAGYKTVFGVNGIRRLVSADAPIDWNGDGDTNDTVAADPNRLEYSCGRTPGELLKGGDDWRNLQWTFAASPDNASGAHFTADTLATSELTEDVATSVASTSDVDADGVSNLADLCPSVPDHGAERHRRRWCRRSVRHVERGDDRRAADLGTEDQGQG